MTLATHTHTGTTDTINVWTHCVAIRYQLKEIEIPLGVLMGQSPPHKPGQHNSLLERVRPTAELGPVDPVLVAAPVVTSMIPHTIEVGVGTGVVPPAPTMVQGTVT